METIPVDIRLAAVQWRDIEQNIVTFLINRRQSCIKDFRVLVHSSLYFYLDPDDHPQKSCNYSTAEESVPSSRKRAAQSRNHLQDTKEEHERHLQLLPDAHIQCSDLRTCYQTGFMIILWCDFTYHAEWLDQNGKVQDPTEDCAACLHRECIYTFCAKRSEARPAYSWVWSACEYFKEKEYKGPCDDKNDKRPVGVVEGCSVGAACSPSEVNGQSIFIIM